MRDDAVRIGPPHLRPERGLHVLPQRRHGKACESIDAACNTFDVATLVELRETDLEHAGVAGLRRGEVPGLPLGQLVERRVPLTAFHDQLARADNIMSWLIIDKPHSCSTRRLVKRPRLRQSGQR